eukprot:678685-Amphidinium_carterae.1
MLEDFFVFARFAREVIAILEGFGFSVTSAFAKCGGIHLLFGSVVPEVANATPGVFHIALFALWFKVPLTPTMFV